MGPWSSWGICSRQAHLTGSKETQKLLTRLIGAILAVTVIIVHLIERDGGCAIQTRERLRFVIEVMVWGTKQEVRHGSSQIHQHTSVLPIHQNATGKLRQKAGNAPPDHQAMHKKDSLLRETPRGLLTSTAQQRGSSSSSSSIPSGSRPEVCSATGRRL